MEEELPAEVILNLPTERNEERGADVGGRRELGANTEAVLHERHQSRGCAGVVADIPRRRGGGREGAGVEVGVMVQKKGLPQISIKKDLRRSDSRRKLEGFQ